MAKERNTWQLWNKFNGYVYYLERRMSDSYISCHYRIKTTIGISKQGAEQLQINYRKLVPYVTNNEGQ